MVGYEIYPALVGFHLICGYSHRRLLAALGDAEASSVPSIATDLRKEGCSEALIKTTIFQFHRLGADGNFDGNRILPPCRTSMKP